MGARAVTVTVFGAGTLDETSAVSLPSAIGDDESNDVVMVLGGFVARPGDVAQAAIAIPVVSTTTSPTIAALLG
jgi:hypothetical protein